MYFFAFRKAYEKIEGAASRIVDSLCSSLSQVEEAVSFLWATKYLGYPWLALSVFSIVFFSSLASCLFSLRLQAAIDWSHWGEAVSSDLRPMLPLAPQFSALFNGAGAHVAEPSSDVVLQARQQWAESCGQCLHGTQKEKPTVNPIKMGQPLGGLGEGRRQVQREEPEIDPVSGLEVWQTQSLTIENCANLNDVTLFCYGNSQHFMAFAPFVQGLRCHPSAHHHWRVTSPCREPRSQPNCWVQRRSCGRSLEHEQSISRCPPAVKLCRCIKDVWRRLSVLYIVYIYILVIWVYILE